MEAVDTFSTFSKMLLVLICCTTMSPAVLAQEQYATAAPEYTLVNYILMGTSLFILVSLVFAILLLVRKEFSRGGGATPRQRQIIQVQPRPPSRTGSCEGAAILQELGDGRAQVVLAEEPASDPVTVKVMPAQ